MYMYYTEYAHLQIHPKLIYFSTFSQYIACTCKYWWLLTMVNHDNWYGYILLTAPLNWHHKCTVRSLVPEGDVRRSQPGHNGHLWGAVHAQLQGILSHRDSGNKLVHAVVINLSLENVWFQFKHYQDIKIFNN